MLIFDLFSGTGSATQAFEDAGHTVLKFELDEQFEATEYVDVLKLDASYLLEKYGRPDFVWASPPCTAFSVVSIGHHWNKDNTPKTDSAREAIEIVKHTRKLIEELDPKLGWLMENPVGKLRKLDLMKGVRRFTITYCQYGDNRQKPTDLFGVVPGWRPKPMCGRGAPCHVASPRGSNTGTTGLWNVIDRSRVPYGIAEELIGVLKHGD